MLKIYLETRASIGIGDLKDKVLSNLQGKYKSPRKLNCMGSNRKARKWEHYIIL